ncbi:MAG: GGDEF domain-containing protein [Spirochaetia bacterium]|jgi:diguanylate cyclase (GGDEF)-like protein|nr:GGDEF domain-containing protein [Spirochaetia bacterium]
MADTLKGLKETLLKDTDLFSSLLGHEIELIVRNSEFHNYKINDPVFSKGDPGNSLYIVESGEVVVQKEDDNNNMTDIARFLPGDCFGELDLFTETPRIASAFASAKTRLLVFPEDGTGFSSLLKNQPGLSALILHKILVNIAGRIRRANDLVKENSPLVQELRKQVYRDKLTGIFNQTYLSERIRELINKNAEGFALIITKPDNFKNLNDTYGHDAGDMAIRILARRLREFIGDDSRTARYKGNAMAVLLPGATKEEAGTLAKDIRAFMIKLDVSEACKGSRFDITASIGISMYPDHGKDAEELLSLTHELPLLGRCRGGNMILFPEDAGETE